MSIEAPSIVVARRAMLDDQAVACLSKGEFLEQRSGIHSFKLHGAGRQKLHPAIWKGAGDPDAYHCRTEHLPAVRIYSFCDRPVVLGRVAILNGGEFMELGYRSFTETSRFNTGSDATLIEHFADAEVSFRMPGNRLHIPGDCAVLAQKGDGVWGHWLVDILPRISIIRALLPEATIAVPNAPGWSMDLLMHAGIPADKVLRYDPLSTTISADRIFLPSFLRFANAFSPLAAKAFATLPLEMKPLRKLYVTRSGTVRGSCIHNSEEIERLFRDRGFEVVSPEAISLQDQVALFAGASHIAGEYGSGLHNTVFSAPGTRVLSLQSASMHQFVQAGIGAVTDQPTGFVFGDWRQAPSRVLEKHPSLHDRYFWLDHALVVDALGEFLAT